MDQTLLEVTLLVLLFMLYVQVRDGEGERQRERARYKQASVQIPAAPLHFSSLQIRSPNSLVDWTHMDDTNVVILLQHGPVLTLTAIWEMNQQVENMSLSFALSQ